MSKDKPRDYSKCPACGSNDTRLPHYDYNFPYTGEDILICEKCGEQWTDKAAQSEIDSLKAKLAIATEALEFYAKVGVWGIAGPGDRVSIDPVDWQQVECGEMKQLDMRGGKFARQALEKLKEGE